MRFLLLVMLAAPVLAATAQFPVDLAVEVQRKKEKTGESNYGNGSIRQMSFVESSTLKIALSAQLAQPAKATVRWFFVAQDPVTRKLSYYGFGESPVGLSRVAEKLTVTSETVASKEGSGSGYRESPTGVVPHGWVVIVEHRGEEIAVKSSGAGSLEWIRKNPPQAAKRKA